MTENHLGSISLLFDTKGNKRKEIYQTHLPKLQIEDHYALLQNFQGHLQMQCLHHMPLQALPYYYKYKVII